jgi:hypothetical protein
MPYACRADAASTDASITSLADGSTIRDSTQGFAIGLVTHRELKGLSVVWISGPLFDSKPSRENAAAVTEWRWATTLPVGSGVRQKLFLPLGTVDVPARFHDRPIMRTWTRDGKGWNKIRVEEEFRNTRSLGRTDDRSLSIYSVMTATMLAERIENGWNPPDDW